MRPKELCSGARNFVVAMLVSLVATSSAEATHDKIIHNFIAFPHGANPQASLIADAAGNLYGTTYEGGTYGFGTVFELMPSSNGKWNQAVLYNFSGGSDGANPSASLVFDAMGNLYGTTATGGISKQQCQYYYEEIGCGVVFKLTPTNHGSWTESVLYSFNGYPDDGQTPVSGLIFDTAGNIYGTTKNGGTYGSASGGGTVFELTFGSNGIWTENILHNFSNGSDGAAPLGSLISDSSGNLYGTTYYGGDQNCNLEDNNTTCGTVFELSRQGNGTWTETVLHTFIYSDGAYPMGSLVFDSTGSLYGTTSSGPGVACDRTGCGTTFQLKPNSDGTWTQTIIYNFEGGADGSNPTSGLILGNDGELYGTTQNGGGLFSCNGGCGTIFELTRHRDGTWKEEVIHSFGVSSANSEGREPVSSLLLDSHGNLYGTAEQGGSIGGFCSTYGYYGGCGTVFKLAKPHNRQWNLSVIYVFSPAREGLDPTGGLTSDDDGNLYGATLVGGTNTCSSGSGGDGGCGTIFKLTHDTNGHWTNTVLHTFDGLTDGAGPLGNLIRDSSGNLYGTTKDGGSADCIGYYAPCGGTVFEVSPTRNGWRATVLHKFHIDGGLKSDGARPLAGLVMDSGGSLYGTTSLGGNLTPDCQEQPYLGCGTVFKLGRTGDGRWKEEVLYAFQGGLDANSPEGTLIFDSQGALYGTSCLGGSSGAGTVFKLTPDVSGRWTESVLYSFKGSQYGDGFCPGAGLVADGDGNLFGTTRLGGSYENNCYNGGCGVVFEVSPTETAGWKETVLLTFRGSDGSNPEGTLIFDAVGNLYGSTPSYGSYLAGGTVFELSPGSNGWAKQVLHHFGTGKGGSGPDGSLLFDQSGNIFGTTGAGGIDGNGTIFELSPGDLSGRSTERSNVKSSHLPKIPTSFSGGDTHASPSAPGLPRRQVR